MLSNAQLQQLEEAEANAGPRAKEIAVARARAEVSGDGGSAWW